MNQQGVGLSKKISKMKIIFWFDFQRCSHGPSKIGHHFRKQSGSKNDNNKKPSSKLIFLNEKKIKKDWNNFLHRKLT